MSRTHTINPYRWDGIWVFDDERVGIEKEPFLFVAEELINLMVADIPDAEAGFRLRFASARFQGAAYEFVRGRAEAVGFWYRSEAFDLESWIADAIIKCYFRVPPERIFVQTQPRLRRLR